MSGIGPAEILFITVISFIVLLPIALLGAIVYLLIRLWRPKR